VAKSKHDPRDPLICCCNEVPRSQIIAAIRKGACSMAAIFDATWAGCGPCGGTCQPEIAEILRVQLELQASTPASGREGT
jgi:NAD(P)H-nitrite reductase large subunit